MIRQNVDKFSPVFWQLMEDLSKSKKAEDKRLFITEFNKLQVKMIPQTVQGDEDNPIAHTVTGINIIKPDGTDVSALTETIPSMASSDGQDNE